MSEATAAAHTKSHARVQRQDAPLVEPEKRESPQQVKAREMRAELGHIVLELQKGDFALRQVSAALMAAHMSAEFEGAAGAMSSTEVQDYASKFRLRYPGAWGRAAASNVLGFIRALDQYGLKHGTVEQYQHAIGALTS